jgi:hypothetical protein
MHNPIIKTTGIFLLRYIHPPGWRYMFLRLWNATPSKVVACMACDAFNVLCFQTVLTQVFVTRQNQVLFYEFIRVKKITADFHENIQTYSEIYLLKLNWDGKDLKLANVYSCVFHCCLIMDRINRHGSTQRHTAKCISITRSQDSETVGSLGTKWFSVFLPWQLHKQNEILQNRSAEETASTNGTAGHVAIEHCLIRVMTCAVKWTACCICPRINPSKENCWSPTKTGPKFHPSDGHNHGTNALLQMYSKLWYTVVQRGSSSWRLDKLCTIAFTLRVRSPLGITEKRISCCYMSTANSRRDLFAG